MRSDVVVERDAFGMAKMRGDEQSIDPTRSRACNSHNNNNTTHEGGQISLPLFLYLDPIKFLSAHFPGENVLHFREQLSLTSQIARAYITLTYTSVQIWAFFG